MPRLRDVLPVAGVVGIGFFGSVVITPLYPLYERDFGFSPLVLTFVYAAYTLGNVLSLLLFGRLSDQLGRKRVILPTLGVAALAGVLFLLATSTPWLVAGRIVIGLAVGILSGSATAWLVELYGPERRATATVISAVANLIGIAVGPLTGGLLAQYAPFPLRLPLAAFLVLVVVLAVTVARVPDERGARVEHVRDASIRPAIGLPPGRAVAFVAPAICAFVVFAVGGLYFALVPSIVRRDLHIANLAVAGAIVFEFGVAGAVAVVLARDLRPGVAMTTGLLSLLVSVPLIAVAQGSSSLALLLVATACAGVTLALGYRGSLEVVNAIADDDQRGQLTSSYLIACFCGNSLPVLGIGLVSTVASPLTGTIAFAAVLCALAAVALVVFRRVGLQDAGGGPA